MRFRNWLLTGTSLTLLALAPISVARAQDASDPALVAAYQAYQAAQDDTSKQALTEACIAAGFQSLDDCIAALSKAAPAPAPKEETPAPAPSSEEAAPPPSSEEAAPPPSQEAAPAPASEEAAPPPPPSSEEVAPSEAAPPASSEEPKAKPKQKPKKPAVVSSSEEAAPVAASSEEAAPAPSSEEAAPAVTEPSSEAAPVASSEEAAPAPSSEEAAPPASSAEAAPASSEQPAPAVEGAPKQLIAAVDLYNQGVADLTAGDANGQKKIDNAKGQIDKLCAAGGFADTDTCLAQFGLVLNPLPAKPGEPSSEAAAPSSEQAAPASETPISELPNASEAVTPSAVEVLPPTVAPSEAAPILDSAKDSQTEADKGQPAAPDQSSSAPASSSEAAAPAEPPAPPPTDDKQAQADIKAPPADDVSAVKEKGKKRDKPPEVVLVPAPADTDQDIKVIEQPKRGDGDKGKNNTGVVIQIGVNIIIRNPEQERDRYYDPKEDQIYYEDLSRGRTRETVVRPNGVKIVTVRSRHGDILQRSKILKNGREIVLATYDPNDNDIDSWKDPGDDLPPLRLTIPADQYILDTDSADEAEVSDFLEQPPVEQVRRIYTIDEVKRSARLRDSVRRLEVGGLTFDTGKATISRDQVGALSKVAKAMQTALDRNEGEVFLIEGHTDAVGSDVANLVLSDQRAATVARILTDFYDIPAENLVTQGYGERYLKVKTEGPEPLNRRVTVKRITSLISYASAE